MNQGIRRALTEPSSWAGIATIVQGVALLLPQYSGIVGPLAALLGALAVGLREKGPVSS